MTDFKIKTRKLAVSAIISALCVVILYLGSAINIFDLTAVAVVSLIMMFAVSEIGFPFHWAIYGVVAVLSMLLLPDKFAAVAFLVLGGIYPILRPRLEKMPVAVSFIMKLLYFNVVLTGIIAASLFVLKIKDDRLGFNILTYSLGNVTIFLYDFCIGIISNAYIKYFRKLLKADKLFGKK